MEYIRNEGFTFTALPPDSVLSWTYIPLINFPSPNFKLHQGAACQHKPSLGFEFINIKSYWICRPQGSRLHSIYTHGQILTSTLTASNYSMFAGTSNFSVYTSLCEVRLHMREEEWMDLYYSFKILKQNVKTPKLKLFQTELIYLWYLWQEKKSKNGCKTKFSCIKSNIVSDELLSFHFCLMIF